MCNLTKQLPIPIGEDEVFGSETIKERGMRVVTWLINDQAIIVSDKYDLWQLDPEGKRPPINLTNGYGRRHNITLRISGNVNAYHVPYGISNQINIPWFVSQGYLVFTPDIYYSVGKTGQSAYNTVSWCCKILVYIRMGRP